MDSTRGGHVPPRKGKGGLGSIVIAVDASGFLDVNVNLLQSLGIPVCGWHSFRRADPSERSISTNTGIS